MKSTLSLSEHVALSQNRWLTALLADFHARGGARHVELLNRLGLSKDSLGRTLESAIALGWVARNTGYGHPLRPEYVITKSGKHLGACAHAILQAQAALGLAPADLTRWSMPLVHVLRSGEERFGQIQSVLLTATPRALSQGLQSLEGLALLDRTVVEERPPFSRYTLTAGGILLADAA